MGCTKPRFVGSATRWCDNIHGFGADFGNGQPAVRVQFRNCRIIVSEARFTQFPNGSASDGAAPVFYCPMKMWHLKHGSWWMVQWTFDWWLSVGAHLDVKCRHRDDGQSYGPYLDLHFICFILSIGYHPHLSGELEKSVSVSRGGL